MADIAQKVAGRLAFETVRQQAAHERKHPETRATYQALGRLSDRYGYRDVSLSAAEDRVFSQNGEDGVIAEILHRIGTGARFFVEFGVENGTECNTRLLADVLGWDGLYFEPDPQAFVELSHRHSHKPGVQTVQAFVTPATINDQFRAADVPRDLDLLSIDIDGQDLWTWRALEDTYRPRLVVIEFNAGLSGTQVEREGCPHQGFVDTFGASIGALRKLAAEKGYTLVHCDLSGINAFFVRDDLADGFPEPILRTPNYLLAGHRHPPGDRSALVDF